MLFRSRKYLWIAAAAVCTAVGARAQMARFDQVFSHLESVHSFSGVAISPDARWVAWVESAPGKQGAGIYLFDRKNANQRPRRITTGDGQDEVREGGIAWSPDSRHFAFLSDADYEGQPQIYIAAAAGGVPRKLTNLDGYVIDLRWSPDGKRIAFLYTENGGGGGPLAAAPTQLGVVGSKIRNQRIAIVKAGGGSIRQVTPVNLNIYQYDWSPDGTQFAAIAAPGPADNNWWIANLYIVDGRSGAMRLLYHPPMERQIALPRWSPDGTSVAFIGGIMSDEAFSGGDIFEIPASGGKLRDLTKDLKATPTGFSWRGKQMLLTEYVDGESAIAQLNPATGAMRRLWKGAEDLRHGGRFANCSFAQDGRTAALVQSSWRHAPEVWAGPIGHWRQITHANDSQHPQWGKPESIFWNNGGFRVQGWLLYPRHFDPAKRYPMVVSIHGGPANCHLPQWPSTHFDMSVMSALGYFVFFPNFRGGYGEGEAFTRANIKDFGGGDLQDILSGVDAVLKRVPVDTNRIGIAGWSYGGYMTMWAVTQTHRFGAAVAGAGISDWRSYYGENLIDKWMLPYFGASVYDDPAVYAKSSPIRFVKNVKTPTLMVVGQYDAECPAPQSFEFWHALKTLGVPTELVVYPNEGHSFQRLSDLRDDVRRTVEWFNSFLAPTEAAK
ncbi:MAG TPA: S9 family peptidase [Bryobacteraceae bacterium]